MKNAFEFVQAIIEFYDPPFPVVVELLLNEAAQYVNLNSWETDQQKWAMDDQGRAIGSRDVTLTYDDINKTIAPGESISKTKNVFLPVPFAISKEDATPIMRQILAAAKKNGSVKLTTWPAYGVDNVAAYPAAFVAKLPADEKSLALQVGLGGAVYAIDGSPVSRVLRAPLPIGAEGENLTTYAKWTKWAGINVDETGAITGRTEEGPPPEWLLKLHAVINSTLKDPNVVAESSRMVGFEGDIIFSTAHGDAVLVLSKERSRAGYVFKKKVNLDGSKVDYDVAISKKMEEFKTIFSRKPRGVKNTGETDPIPQGDDVEAFKSFRKKAKDQLKRAKKEQDTGEKRAPKLMLRDWLNQTQNGYVLRRDFRAEDIKRLLSGGVNYIDGLRLADHEVDIPVQDEPVELAQPEADKPSTPGSEIESEVNTFEDRLDLAMVEPILENVDSFLSIIENPWSIDDRGLLKYLQTAAPEDLENWVDALDMAVNERGIGNRWVHALVEQTYEKLGNKIPLRSRPIIMGMLEQIQAAPWPTEPTEQDEADEYEETGPGEPLEEFPGPDTPPEDYLRGTGLHPDDQKPPKPKKPDFDDDYNPEADFR